MRSPTRPYCSRHNLMYDQVMLISLLLVAAAPAITATERSIIMDAVKAEVSGGNPSFGPIPAGADTVCGRVNGYDFQVALTRNEKGRIVEAGQVTVMTPDTPATLRQFVYSLCSRNGYKL